MDPDLVELDGKRYRLATVRQGIAVLFLSAIGITATALSIGCMIIEARADRVEAWAKRRIHQRLGAGR